MKSKKSIHDMLKIAIHLKENLQNLEFDKDEPIYYHICEKDSFKISSDDQKALRENVQKAIGEVSLLNDLCHSIINRNK